MRVELSSRGLAGAVILAMAFGSAWAPAADNAASKPAAKPSAKPAPPPVNKEKVPDLSPADLQKIQDALPSKATAASKQARRVLVIWRCEGFFHGQGIAAGNKALELMGQKTGAFAVDTTRELDVLTPANLAKYDAVIFNNTTLLNPSDQQKQALLEYVNGGKGLVGIHAATDNFYKWPEGAQMMGGLFVGHPWGGGGTWGFKLDEPDHSLLRAFGGKGFKLRDEIYQFRDPYTRNDRRVLLSLDLSDSATADVAQKNKKPRSDNDYAVSWIKTAGQGRVFYCSLGHAGNVFQEPAVLQYYLDGIQYAIGDLPADATPKK